jgi:hypothetical protein
LKVLFIETVVLKIVGISLSGKIVVSKLVDRIKITTIPNNFKPIPAFIKSDGFTLLCNKIIAFGGVARRINLLNNE